MSKILAYWKDESGAAAAEYALILAIICAGIAVAMTTLGANIITAVNNAATAIIPA